MAKRERGRPEHERTPEIAERVMLLSSQGWPVVQIAQSVGLANNTLRKYYADEMAHGWVKLQLRLLIILLREAEKGKVSAAKALCDGFGMKPRRCAVEPARDGKPERAAQSGFLT